jgi:hypothetical protein
MKRFMLSGGFAGFLLTFVTSFGSGSDLGIALRDGMIGCLLVAFVSRLFYRQIENAAISVLQAENNLMEKEETEEYEAG